MQKRNASGSRNRGFFIQKNACRMIFFQLANLHTDSVELIPLFDREWKFDFDRKENYGTKIFF